MKKYLTAIVVLLTFANCTSEKADTPSTNPTTKTYFPPVTGTAWETKTIESLGWKSTAVQPLLDYLTQKNCAFYAFWRSFATSANFAKKRQIVAFTTRFS